jgi:hypothetical protein
MFTNVHHVKLGSHWADLLIISTFCTRIATFHVVCYHMNHCHYIKLEGGIVIYHIFCCNMFVFACPIIARSQCWLFALRANIRICSHISVLALKYPYCPPNLTSGICNLVSKKICQSTRKDGKIVFQSN